MKMALARACAVASLCALALATWLYLPAASRALEGTSPALRVCVFDASSTAVSRSAGWEAWMSAALRSEAGTARDAGEDLCVIGFGAEVKRIFGPLPAGEFLRRAAADTGSEGRVPGLRLRDGGSRMKSALEVAREVLAERPRGPARIRLYVDRTYTDSDPRSDLVFLADDGVAIEWVPMLPATASDAALAAVIVPERIEAGAPLSIACDVRIRPGSRAWASLDPRLHLRAVRPSGLIEREIALAAPVGAVADEDGYLGWRVRCDLERAEPGLTRLAARMRARGDSVAENDSAQASILCAGSLVVGYVGGEGAEHALPEWLAKLQSSGGVQAIPIASSALDRELAALDVLVTGDVAPDALPADLLAAFVERGGGWLSLAGFESWRAYLEPLSGAAGGARGAENMGTRRLLSLLPLQPLDQEPTPRDVLFVIDATGSMVGEPFDAARAAVGSLLTFAGARDTVGVCLFGARLGEELPLLPAGDSPRSDADLRAAEAVLARLAAPGGPTALLGSLEELAEKRARSQHEALVLLFSDGRDVSDPDPQARGRSVSQRLAASRTRLLVVAVGDDPDRELLAALVPDAQRLLEVRALGAPDAVRAIRELFLRELGSQRMHAESAAAVSPVRELRDRPNALGAALLAAEMAAVREPWPSVERFVLARAAPRAEVVWTSPSGDPLLGLQRVGLGLSAACAFAIPDWAPLWSGRDDLLGPLVRALGREARARSARISAVGGELRLDGLDPDAPALLEARIFESSAQASPAPIARALLTPQVAGVDPRGSRIGTIPAVDALAQVGGTLRVEVHRLDAGARDQPLFELPLALERAPEFCFPRQRVVTVQVSGPGVARPADRSRSGSDARDRGAHPAARPVLAAALLLLAATAMLGFYGRPRR